MVLDEKLGIRDDEAEKAIRSLRNSSSELLLAFRSKLEALRGNNEITKYFLRQGYDRAKCCEEAKAFLGSEEVKYLAIDGTKFEDYRLDLAVFFAGAFAYKGKLHFTRETGTFAGPPESSDGSLTLSSAVPVSEEYASKVNSEHTEGGEIDPERISSSLMRLSEYYLALSAAKRDPDIKVLLFDRTISGDIAHISWKMREYIDEGRSILEGQSTSFGKITMTDLELGRMLIVNKELGIPAPRSQLLKYAVMEKLIEEEGRPLTPRELVESLGANKSRAEGIAGLLRDTRVFSGSFSIKKSGEEDLISASKELKYFRERIREGADKIAEHVFYAGGGHPLKFDPERWITSEDVDYATLIMITELLEEAWKRNILILGIVKDSSANELVKTVSKILENSGLLHLIREIPRFESDRMMLQANSVVNSSILPTPWRTFEYDVCFRTVSPAKNKAGENRFISSPIVACPVEGAFKNVIAPERNFVKAYFQLWSSPANSSVRSHVFLYDRPCYPRYERFEDGSEIALSHKDSVEEKIVPAIHYLTDAKISDLIMSILCAMGGEPIPEALGHNYPLFLADKRAKIAEKEARMMCSAAVELEIARSKLDQQTLYERRFRDYRSGLESKRT